MSIPLDKVVSTTVQIAPTAVPSEVGLGVLCVLGASSRLPIGDRIRFYGGLDEVGVDFSTTDPEYVVAKAAFSQSPAPSSIAIARRFSAAVPGELLGSVTCDKLVDDYKAIATGSLSLKIDGTDEAATGIDLSGVTTLNGVASAVQTALAALKAGTTVVYDGTRFIIRSGTNGATSSVGFATVAGSGTDLAPLMGLRAADLGTVTPGAAAESITDSLSAIQTLNPRWYGVVLAGSDITDQNILDAAAWVEAQTKMLGYVSSSNNVLTSSVTNDLASQLATAKYKRTMGQWDSVAGADIASILACLFTTDFTQPNSSKTLKFKLEPGVVPVTITESQRQVLEAKHINYYTYFGSNAMFAPGVMADGGFADERYALDALQNDIQSAVFAFVYSRPTKVPATDKGVASIVQVIERVLKQYVDNGTLAPSVWNGNAVGQKQTGDFLEKGFYVYASPVSQQLPADRAARKAPPITIIATGAGAIHNISINIVFQQ